MNAQLPQIDPNVWGFLDPQESLSEGLWQSFPILGYRGKQWTLRYKGQEYYFMGQLPGGQQVPMPYIDIVILRQANWLSKTFYEGAFDPVTSMGKRPDCASKYGDVPDPGVSNPQAESCAVCPQNVFKLTPEGRRNKPCSDFKELAVLLLPSDTERLLGTPLMEPVLLRVPPASLSSLNSYGNELRQSGIPYAAVLTRVMFDQALAHPQMTFAFQQVLTPDEAPAIRELRGSPVALRITGEDISPETRALRHQETTRALPPAQQGGAGSTTIDVPARQVAPQMAILNQPPLTQTQSTPQAQPARLFGGAAPAGPAPASASVQRTAPAPVQAGPQPTGLAGRGNGHVPAAQTGPADTGSIPPFLQRAPEMQAQTPQPEETTVVAADDAIDSAIGDILNAIKK